MDISYRGVSGYLKLGGQVVMLCACCPAAPSILPKNWAHPVHPPLTPLSEALRKIPTHAKLVG